MTNKVKNKAILLSLLAASLVYSSTAHAESAAQTSSTAGAAQVSIYLDGSQLATETSPILVNGAVLVPMRSLFEAQGAKLGWDSGSKTVTATKDGTKLVYRIGETTAELNGQMLDLAVPGQISGGYSLVPLRFVSEALGSAVEWDENTRKVTISSLIHAETTVLWGVNLRSSPDAESKAIGDLLPSGEKVQVLREASPFWLEVRTKDNRTGFISAKPKYTDYSNAALREQQADELIAYGKTFLGAPYEFGASPDQTKTFDCSSFVKRVFSEILSVDLPRVSYDQAKEGKEVSMDELQKGDLLFFDARGLDIGHVAIYAGDNQLLHTYSKKYGVMTGEFTGQWKERFVTARRVF
ncbi:SH3 domain-containing protein [Fontibacillus phaseoli]|uniref:SH3 domain-containing protein n=1 Tax=Fontibacillus phaseoli TaxID=1416533 RepID=A0A369BAZ7_9BACL|nr:stalk domain-containing protein [Fontibacillus phaseoli]RCX17768.1 SH3 domain-containing protein [Fontibacillus phaseoli]